jgi:hypothetical protein
MKKIVGLFSVALIVISCGDANDGNALTDTSTTIPPDTALLNERAGDSAGTINRNTGSYPADSASVKKNDVRSSSSAYPDGRGVQKGGDSSRQ